MLPDIELENHQLAGPQVSNHLPSLNIPAVLLYISLFKIHLVRDLFWVFLLRIKGTYNLSLNSIFKN